MINFEAGLSEIDDISLPIDWENSPLVEFSNIEGGGKSGLTKQSDYVSFGFPAFSAAGKDGFVDKPDYIEKAAVILSSIGANCGKCFYINGSFAALANTQVIIPNNQKVDAQFLFYIVNRINYWERSGSAQPFIKPSHIKKSRISYPKDIREQTQIATILSKVDEAISQTEQLIAKYTRIKTGLMQDLLTKGIDEHGNIRSEATHEFKDSPLGRIPKEWEVKSLKEVTKHDITYGIVQAGPHIENGVPYIRTGDMSGDVLSIEGLLRTTQTIAARFTRSTVRAGEIVFALRATIGKVLLVPNELDGANLTQGTARISANEERLINQFLLWCLRMPYFNLQILQNQKGTTFFEISLTQLRKMEVSFPKNIDEQRKIVNVMENIELSIISSTNKYNKLQSLKTGLMQDLLSGKVRVNHLIKETASV